MKLSYLSPKAVVRDSVIHGRGLFAIGEFRAGEIVCVKGGHIVARTTLEAVAPVLGPAEVQVAEDLFIGPFRPDDREGSMIFSNHSCAAALLPERTGRFRTCNGNIADGSRGTWIPPRIRQLPIKPDDLE